MRWIDLRIPVLLVAVLVGVVVFCGKRRCYRGLGFVLMLGLLAAIFFGGMWMRRLRSDFGGWPTIERVASTPQVLRSMPYPSTRPATQTSQLWVDDWQAYLDSTNFRGFRAESSDTSPTAQASLDEATRQAVSDLQQMLLNDGRVLIMMRNLPMSRQTLAQRLESEIRTGSLVVGQSVRSIEKSYGTLWKTYLLVDTSPQKLEPLIRQLDRQMANQRRDNLTAAASIGGTMLVVLLLYAFLNTVTKGYFVWRLRAAVILVLIAGVLVFFANV